MESNGTTYDAHVVSYDPNMDISILDVPKLSAQPLSFSELVPQSGIDALVLGYPDGGDIAATPARIRETISLNGPDIYRTTTVTREVYTIRGTVRQGDSGGPLLFRRSHGKAPTVGSRCRSARRRRRANWSSTGASPRGSRSTS